MIKKQKNNKNNKRKKMLLVLGISVLTVLGSTIAYFTTSTDFVNIFKTALYQNEIVEEFVAPDNWTPGTTTNKQITIKNTGSINMAVRASYVEEWTSSNGTKLPLRDSENNVAAIINFNQGWTKNSDGYYYYGAKENMTKLHPNEITNSFLSGVTFNNNIKSSLRETISNDGKIVTYSSTGSGYDDATYKLTIKIDTIQYDQAQYVW